VAREQADKCRVSGEDWGSQSPESRSAGRRSRPKRTGCRRGAHAGNDADHWLGQAWLAKSRRATAAQQRRWPRSLIDSDRICDPFTLGRMARNWRLAARDQRLVHSDSAHQRETTCCEPGRQSLTALSRAAAIEDIVPNRLPSTRGGELEGLSPLTKLILLALRRIEHELETARYTIRSSRSRRQQTSCTLMVSRYGWRAGILPDRGMKPFLVLE